MRISYNWLKELTGVDWTPEQAADRLTMCGTAVEEIEPADQYLAHVVVGRVLAVKPIEGADKIRLATVDLGTDTRDIVCGAPNVAPGQLVPVALEGARLAGGIEIRKTKIRGIESSAMICSHRELGLSDEHAGIWVLPFEASPGDSLAQAAGLKDYIFHFDLTPNRPDSLSAIGLARDLAALAERPLTRPQFDLKESSTPADRFISIQIDDPDACPRYACRVFRGITIGPSPWWIQRKLLLSGMRPISNVVDITNLVLLETGHPLHAFDLDRFGSNRVVVRQARQGEKFTTLDSQEHELTPDVLLITNGSEGVATGGVMGGLFSEVQGDTTNLLLEGAYFDARLTRKSRRYLGLVTEASQRFEKGGDPNAVPFALDRAAFLIQAICGGEVCSGIVDCYPRRIERRVITFRPDRCNDLMGTALAPERMKRILVSLECSVEAGSNEFAVSVPTFRPDIEREVDLIEEVTRIIGFDGIAESTENIGPLYAPIHHYDRFFDDVRQAMLRAGFDEAMHHCMVHDQRASLIEPGAAFVRLLNPVSEELNIMRRSLVPTMLEIVAHNLAHRNIDLRLFEIGKSYVPGAVPGELTEDLHLIAAVAGSTEQSWREKPRPMDFYDLTGALEDLRTHFAWGEIRFEPTERPYLSQPESFAVVVGDIAVGTVGLIDANLARRFDIKQPVRILELNLEPLMGERTILKQFEPLPIYPAAPRDVAVIVGGSVRAADLVAAVKKAAGEIAEAVHIFDLYTGKPIPEGKKSLALSISYRSRTGNLSGEQIDVAQEAVTAELRRRFDAQIRDK